MPRSSWDKFVNQVRGPSYLANNLEHIPHWASTYLQTLKDQGTEVNMDDPPWTSECLASCTKWGPHPSTTNLHHDFFQDEYANFIQASFWVVLPLEQVHALNKDLYLSPMAVKV